ncbi:hypothetical protein [Corynebacterium freneyi]|uniref:Uncharacterized protein n=1 Tax=Corynebacterium freneyi TaxID=134034 RepID=A0ABS4U8Q7_9CORY|nr:hypothetical protein [Corynebacterium freneyi]MBP2333037.1 hypothetical protein [Corynebacterium freneyi]QXA52865.1 hypothetical protein I6L56_12805 [Corynebacterium freneyi]WJZ04861.1 hypothetical protein CFREN_04415 [Corynebacterium freneyi]
MFGLESVGRGRDVRVEGAGVPEFETPLGAPAAELAAQAWRGQVEQPREDKLAELRTWVDGLPAKLRDSFLGEAVAGFEEVSNGIRDGLVQGFADAIRDAEGLGERLIPVRDAARALIRPVEDRMTQVEESQLSEEEQLALLEGVRGYGAAYQRWNENLRSAPGNRRRISLAPHGAAKGVRVEGGGIFIDEPGVWTVHAQVFARGTSFTPGLGSDDITKLFVILREYQPVYKTSTIKEVYGKGGNGPHHIQASFTVVIENAPALLDFEVFSDRWRYFDGGTALTSFSVVKTDSRVENPGEVTVPDA